MCSFTKKRCNIHCQMHKTYNWELFEKFQASYPPYIFEVYLKEHVNESASKATVVGGLVKFKIEKSEHELWNRLQAAEVEDKKFMAAARQKAIEDSHKRAELLTEQKAKEKREQERFALREQMKVSCCYEHVNLLMRINN